MKRSICAGLFLGLFTFACDSAKPEGKTDAAAEAPKAASAAPVAEVKAGADAAPVAADADAPKAAAAATARTAGSPKTVAVKAGDMDKPAAVGNDTKLAAADPKPAGDAAPADDAAPAAGGETVAQKDGWANYHKELKRKIDQTNTACGSKLSGSYDKSTYTAFDPIQDRTQSACQQAVDAMKAVCMTDSGKESVQKLSRVSCKFSTSGTGVSVSGNTLNVKIDPVKSSITGKAAGSYSWASALKENL